MQDNSNKWTKWLPAFVFGVLLIIAFNILGNLPEITSAIGGFFRIVSPFIVGILIFYVLFIPCRQLEKLFAKSKNKFVSKKARLFSVLSVYLIVLALLTGAIALAVPILISSVTDFINSMPNYYDQIAEFVHRTVGHSALDDFDIRGSLMEISNNALGQILQPSNVNQVASGLFGIARGILNIVISLVISMYILLDRERIKKFFGDLGGSIFKEKTKNRMGKYLVQVNNVLFAFIGGKGLNSLVNIVAVTTILLVLDVQYAMLLGLIAGIANFIPFFGSLVACSFIILVSLITGGPAQATWVGVALIIFNQLDVNFIEPRILGRSLKISPILVIFAVVVGGAYFGIAGMFLAVPIAAILKQIAIEYMSMHKERKKIPKEEKA